MPDGRARLAAVPHLLHKPERFCGTAGFTVFLKWTALSGGKEAPVFGSRNPLFFDPSSPKTQVTESRLVVRSVASESLVLSALF